MAMTPPLTGVALKSTGPGALLEGVGQRDQEHDSRDRVAGHGTGLVWLR